MTGYGGVSYLAAAACFAALTVLLASSWRGRRLGAFLIGASLVSVVWAVAIGIDIAKPAFSALTIFVLEVLRSAAWLAFLVQLLARMGIGRLLCSLAHFVWVIVLLAGLAAFFLGDYGARVDNITTVMIPGGLVIALTGLMLIEQLYRNTRPRARRGIQALALGLGGLFAYDLFLYAQGLLFGVIDSTIWVARGAVNVLFVPLIAIAARRNPDWDLNIFVSRQIVFYSTTLIAVGLYLLLMSLGGYALLIYGGTWGRLAQIVFFAGAVLVLVTLLFSSSLRARTKVFLSKHFFRNRYDYREEWLRLIASLASFEGSSTRRTVIRSMAQIVGSPGGWLWMLDDDGKFYQVVEQDGCEGSFPALATDDSLLRFIRKDGWLIDLEEFGHEPKLYDDMEPPDWLLEDDNAWLIVPLMFRQELIGMVMLSKAAGPPKLNYEDRDLLKTVGNHLAVHLAQEHSDSLLAQAQQFEAYNRLTAFLMHDLNNLIAQQSLIIKNAEKHRRNPEFVDDAIQTIANSVERMKRVMDQLRRGEADRRAITADLSTVLRNAVARCADNRPSPVLDLNGVDLTMQVDGERFTMVLTHLIKNAQDATSQNGSVSVAVRQDPENVVITVVDTGSGMSRKFVRDHLFRPFDSTKGSQGMGIGAYQAREFAREMGGEIRVESAVGEGTCITMSVPLGGAKT